MKTLRIAILAVTLAASGSAWAKDPVVLSLGGASSVPATWGSDGQRLGMVKDGSFSAGLASGLQPGGYLAWNGEGWRLEAGLRSSPSAGTTADMGADFGAAPGALGTSISLRFGTAWGGDRFTLSAANPFILESPENILGLTMRINQAVTPNLSFSGSAEARRQISTTDNPVSSNQLLLGARLGLRF